MQMMLINMLEAPRRLWVSKNQKGPAQDPPNVAKRLPWGGPRRLFFFFFFFCGGVGWGEGVYGEDQGGRKDQLNPREGGEEEGLLHSRCK